MNDLARRECANPFYKSLFATHTVMAMELRESTTAERRQKLAGLLDAILARRAAILDAAREDLGRHAVETNVVELLPLVGEIKHALSNLHYWMKTRRISPTLASFGTRSRVCYQPKGRSLVICPWNYPLGLALGPLASAVAAGNTVILKPSEFAPATNRVVKDIVAAIFPLVEVAVVEGGPETATDLLSLPFDHIFFTGSAAVGRKVMAAAAGHLASVTLELGGKSPAIVDASADLRGAAEHIIWGKMVNAGQTCAAPDFAYVHRDVAARFVDLCRETITRRYGATDLAIRGNHDFPRMIHRRHAARVAGLIEDAVEAGSLIACGGKFDVDARYVAPTILTDVPLRARIRHEEIFGPVLPVLTFESLDSVIAEINSAPKPLALYAWTRDAHTVKSLRTQTSSGSLGVNLCLQQFAQHNLPFGGVNSSGIGSAHGFHGFKAFSHERAVMAAGPWSPLKLLFPPYDARKRRLSDWLVGFGA